MKFAAENEVKLSMTIAAENSQIFDQSALNVAFHVMRSVLATCSFYKWPTKTLSNDSVTYFPDK